MELWIRTQNKDELIKPNKLYFKNYVEKVECYAGEVDYHSTDYYDVMSDMGWLGRYSSKQRALEVLDEIQKKMTQTFLLKENEHINCEVMDSLRNYYRRKEINFVEVPNGIELEPINKDILVYEMPDE